MKASSATLAGSVISGILASACCIGPLVFAFLGISGAAFAQAFEPFRAYLLVVTYALLTGAFYFRYRPERAACGPGEACEIPQANRAGKAMLWVAATVVVLATAFPWYSQYLFYEASLDEGEAEVTYDPAKTDPKKIAQSVSKTGFQATVKEDKADTPAKESVGKVELRDLRDWFNAASGSVRVVSLLSPTCPACQCGHGVLKTVFGQTDSRELKGFIVWLPMRPGDDPASVTAEAATFRDERVTEGWDPGRQVGGVFAQALKLRGTAWDVYLVYDRGVRWEGAAPPAPSFWMHQLKEAAGADQKLCLDPARFAREVLARLGMRG